MNRLLLAPAVVLILTAASSAAIADDTFPAPKPRVGFYVVHPRVGLSTYFSLSSSWAGTQAPVRVIAKIHPAGETCGTTAQSDSGRFFGSALLKRDNHHTVWKEWTPTTAGTYVVCTWLGDPALATGSIPLVVAPRTGSLVAALTSETPTGAPRAVFPTAPQSVYARFALRSVKRGALVAIVFRDTNGKSIVTHMRSRGLALDWYAARVGHDRIMKRLGYWLASIRVEDKTLGSIHFLVPAYSR